jgi:signal transduction histidine kinase/CheY-like chemotaxis protein
MTFKHLSVRHKMVILIVSISAFAVSLASFAFLMAEYNFYRGSVIKESTAIANLVAVNSVAAIEFQDTQAATENLSSLKTKSNILFAGLYDMQGDLIAQYPDRIGITASELLWQQSASETELETMGHEGISQIKSDDMVVVKPISLDGQRIGYILLHASFEEELSRLYHILLFSFMTIGFSVLAASVLAYRFQNVITKPIKLLVNTMQTVSTTKDYSLRIPIDRNDEFGMLNEGFNTMVEQIEARNLGLEHARHRLEERVLKRTRELAEARDKAMKANTAKSVFLANMSHEIRTPLNSVLGFAQLLLCDDSLPPKQVDAIQRIETSGTNLLNLINDILDLSKIEAGRQQSHPADFDLQRMLLDLTHMFSLRSREKGLEWRLETNLPERVPVYGDQGKLNQVLINLLGNSVKFTPNGSVTLKVTALPKPDNIPSQCQRYLFEVIDTGIGISEQDQQRIFKPFEQTDSNELVSGTGLGLSIALGQLQVMDSLPLLDSKLGGGSRFYFELELPPAEEELLYDIDKKFRNCKLPPGESVLALVVDDSMNNRDLLTQLLSSADIDVVQAANGLQALDYVRQHLPDIIFMDIRMPVLDGVETLKRLHKEFGKENITAIAISASSLEHQTEYYLESGFNSFISKPFKFEEIFLHLQHLLGIEFKFEELVDPATLLESEITNISSIDLSEEYREKLLELLDLGMVNEIEAIFDELVDQPQTATLIKQCKLLLKGYNFEAIIDLLKHIKEKDG